MSCVGGLTTPLLQMEVVNLTCLILFSSEKHTFDCLRKSQAWPFSTTLHWMVGLGIYFIREVGNRKMMQWIVKDQLNGIITHRVYSKYVQSIQKAMESRVKLTTASAPVIRYTRNQVKLKKWVFIFVLFCMECLVKVKWIVCCSVYEFMEQRTSAQQQSSLIIN